MSIQEAVYIGAISSIVSAVICYAMDEESEGYMFPALYKGFMYAGIPASIAIITKPILFDPLLSAIF